MENELNEWKISWKEDYIKYISAFSNSKLGGTLHIGINDKGEKVGVKNPKELLKKISDTISNTVEIHPDIILDKKNNVISIVIPPSPIPVEVNGRFYRRVGNTTHLVKKKGA